MNQSSAIAAALIVAFVVFVTVRGELPCYLEVMGVASTGCKVAGVTGTAPGFNLFGTSVGTTGGATIGGGGVTVGGGVGTGGGTVRIGGAGGTVIIPIGFPFPTGGGPGLGSTSFPGPLDF